MGVEMGIVDVSKKRWIDGIYIFPRREKGDG